MSKRSIVTLLVGVNVVLLTLMIVTAWNLPEARAQAAPLASNYLMVSAEINNDHDALYVLDLAARVMYVFEIDRTSRQIVLIDGRDLKQDFRGG